LGSPYRWLFRRESYFEPGLFNTAPLRIEGDLTTLDCNTGAVYAGRTRTRINDPEDLPARPRVPRGEAPA
jgi:hypothetical protein